MLGFLGNILGAGKTIAQPVEAVGNVLDKLFTSDDERLTHKELQTKLAMKPSLAQVELNKVEAGHRSIFVAGWRPAIGWVCACGLMFVYVINPIIQWYSGIPGPDMPLDNITELVYGLLGLGALRTVEKRMGVSK